MLHRFLVKFFFENKTKNDLANMRFQTKKSPLLSKYFSGYDHILSYSSSKKIARMISMETSDPH